MRAEQDVEFLASSDNWFRPVQIANAPDGCLYVIDMYRELIEGAAFLPPQILKHLDVGSGVDRGRIWRIVPKGFKRPKPPRLGKATTAELVALLEHPNGWHRDTAVAAALPAAGPRPPSRRCASWPPSSKSPLGRMHALYALDGPEGAGRGPGAAALGDPEPRVREHALRLAEHFRDDPERPARMEEMADDPDLRRPLPAGVLAGCVPGRDADAVRW